MKPLTLLLILFTSLLVPSRALKAQHLPEMWAVRTGGEAIEHALAVTSDANGNLYVTGGLQAEDPGNTDIFLSKYSRDGQAIWQITAGSDTLIYNTMSEYGTDVLCVGDNIYVAGTFMSTANFSGTKVKSRGFDDIFVAKYSASGRLVWVESVGGPSQDLVHSLAADKNGNVYITGSFQQSASFGNKILTAGNSTEMYVAKFNPDGKIIWARQGYSETGSVGKKIHCEENRCLIAGEYRGASDQSKITLTTIEQTDGGIVDHKLVFSQVNISVHDFIVDKGDIYLTGSFFQNLAINDKLTVSKGGGDGYIVKVNPSGKKPWSVVLGGPYLDKGQSLTLDKDDRIILVGSFQKELQMGDSLICGFGADDIFMATITKEGVVSDIEVFGGVGADLVKDSKQVNGSLVLTGHFREVAKFRNLSVESAGASDVLLAKIQLKTQAKSSLKESSSIVNVHPNPSTGRFLISGSRDLGEIDISNTLGQRMLGFRIIRLSSREAEIKADSAFRGVCIVTVTVGNERFVQRVIFQ